MKNHFRALGLLKDFRPVQNDFVEALMAMPLKMQAQNHNGEKQPIIASYSKTPTMEEHLKGN